MNQPANQGGNRRLMLEIAAGLLVVVSLATAGAIALVDARGHHSQPSQQAAATSPTASAAAAASPSPSPSPSASPSPSHAPSPAPTKSPAKATAPPAPAPSGPPHIMVIVEENNSYGAIIGNPQLPYINSLAGTYGLATNWSDVSHPSEPNYLAMVSGSIWDNPQDLTPQDKTYAGPTVVDQLAALGIGWKAYMEDMPAPCDLTDTYSPGSYDVNHNPFMYFTSIRNNPAQCNRDVPFSQFATDLRGNKAPPFMYVVPNLDDDMHNGTYATADTWIKNQLAVVFASRWYASGGIVILTWDEGEGPDQIATIVIAANDHGRRLATAGNHYGLLRCIEQAYGVSLLGNAGNAANGSLRPLF